MEADTENEIRFRGSNLRELERRNQTLQQELERYGGDLYDLQGEIQELQDDITNIHRSTEDSDDTSHQQEILDKMKEIQTKYERMDEIAYHRHHLFLEQDAVLTQLRDAYHEIGNLLEERLEEEFVEERGMNDEDIEDLEGEAVATEAGECSICYEEIAVGQRVWHLPCPGAHRFHIQCLEPWLRRNGSCPMCRAELPRSPRSTPRTPPLARPQSPRADPTTPEGAMLLIDDALEYLQLDGNDQVEDGNTPDALEAHDTPPRTMETSDSTSSILDLLDEPNSDSANPTSGNSQASPSSNGGYTSVFDFGS